MLYAAILEIKGLFLVSFLGIGQAKLELKGLLRDSLNSFHLEARDPSLALAIVQTVVALDVETDERVVQSGLDWKLRPLVYLESRGASTGPSENPVNLHKKNHQQRHHQQEELWARQSHAHSS